MVRYEDGVQALSKQLFQISLDDAKGIQKFVKARQWSGNEYLMVAHYFAVLKIANAWKIRLHREAREKRWTSQLPSVPDNEKDSKLEEQDNQEEVHVIPVNDGAFEQKCDSQERQRNDPPVQQPFLPPPPPPPPHAL